MKNYYHFTLRTLWGTRPFIDREQCVWAWTRLRQLFPVATAVILMPNHFHILAQVLNLSEASARLSRVFAQMPGFRFEALPQPEPIRDVHHHLRQIRYVLLNPCRKGLAADPLAWEWSSYRDLLGLVRKPWMSLEAVHSTLKQRITANPSMFHAYVSGDPSVRVEGTPRPRLGTPLDELWGVRGERALQAAQQFTRAPENVLTESRLVTGVAARFLMDELKRRGPPLALEMGVTPSTLYRRRDAQPALTTRERQAMVDLLVEPRFLGGP